MVIILFIEAFYIYLLLVKKLFDMLCTEGHWMVRTSRRTWALPPWLWRHNRTRFGFHLLWLRGPPCWPDIPWEAPYFINLVSCSLNSCIRLLVHIVCHSKSNWYLRDHRSSICLTVQSLPIFTYHSFMSRSYRTRYQRQPHR